MNQPAPVVKISDAEAASWSMWCHLAGFGGIFFFLLVGNIIGPLIVWLNGRERNAEIDYHGKEAVNFQITATAVSFLTWLIFFVINLVVVLLVAASSSAHQSEQNGAAAVVLVIELVELALYGAIAIFWLYCVISAAVTASKGQRYAYPIALRLIK